MRKILYVTTFLLLCVFESYSQGIEFIEKEEGILLLYNGKKRYFYQIAPKSINGNYERNNYIHPLYGLNEEILTEDFPEDHPHHRGIFWTWHQLYIDTTQVADPWVCTGIQWKIEQFETLITDQRATLKITVNWEVNYKSSPYQIIREETEITYIPTENGYKLLFRIELNPLGNNIKLGGSDDEKGYGGFSFRMKLNDSTDFQANTGSIEPQNLAMDLGNWIELQNIENHNIKVENLSDSNIPFKGWILRKKKSMQNAAIPGRKLLELEKGNPLVLEHSLEVSL